MPRNPSTGVYSKPAGTTPSVGQVIDPAPWNALTTDLGNEITNSLPRDGSAPMIAPLKAAGGTVSAPGVGFASNPQTGVYLKGGGLLGFAQNGVDVAFDQDLVYAAKSGDYTALASDDNAIHRFTAAATLTLTAAATLGANWHIKVIADGGDVTVDANSSETIDGAATLIIPNGYSALIICDGSAFYTDKIISLFQAITFGQCRLSLSGGNLLLSRFNGYFLTINGKHYSIPSAGVTLAPSGLTPATLYYIYAYMNSGTMTLEASATASAVDSTTGIRIKNGDATRTLVGMARPVTGPAWSDTLAQRFVRSWYNEPTLVMFNNFTANRTTTNTSLTELNTEIRNEFLLWTGEYVEATGAGSSINGTSNGGTKSSIAFDGAPPEPSGFVAIMANSDATAFSTQAVKSGLSEGYHYLTLVCAVQGSGTGIWYGDFDGRRTSIKSRISR
ncbi:MULTISPECIES: hypothetical protein [unclassified Rhizobium]|uniref:hypothetical protein n=1 Tax=unclassified Rhizobium TaxID=2613769 RepID=UPI0007F10F61|nr:MULTISPECIES: hypothetical protein [unclassified Rhizobium]ANM09628.1 hypothetical protein AMK05_CH01204 [Rhizobium sp. N324]ANM16097.1 hypothetical protein AMK06_CH01163 [Rhizobium sp. N541]ANM22483.1 hypothetical protein AMK07_CH01161 [Rhizobium sp. N941]OYD03197.1 hypothetical protein AMK08_CH101199 [Rhizobium sp. N4311]